jgi:large subunit ribosomal protein L21
MYAILKTGGKQYKVSPGDKLKIEQIPSDIGEEVIFEDILMKSGNGSDNSVNLIVGKPFVDGSKVIAKIISHGRHEKVKIFKFRRRKHSMKSQGHRQNYTEVEIQSIS